MASVFPMRSQRLLPKSTARGQLLPRPGAWGGPRARFLGYGCVAPLRSCHPPSPPPQAVVTSCSIVCRDHLQTSPVAGPSPATAPHSQRVPPSTPTTLGRAGSRVWASTTETMTPTEPPVLWGTAQQGAEESRLCERRGQGSRRRPFRRPRFSICEMRMVLSPPAWARVCESSGRGARPAKVSIRSCVHQLVDM